MIKEKHIQLIHKECDVRGLSVQTKKAYVSSMRQFLKYYDGKEPEKLGLDEIKDFIYYLTNTKKLQAISVNRAIAGIRFYYMKILNRSWSEHAIPRLKQQKKIPELLSKFEIKRMIHVTRNIKHKAIIMTLYSTGMRLSELARLKAEDIDSKRMVINIRSGKGGDDRQALLSPELLQFLRKYWVENKDDKSKVLFPSSKNWYDKKNIHKQMANQSLNHIVKRAAKLAGIKKKLLRIHCATLLQPIY